MVPDEMDIDAAAEYLGVKTKTLRNWLADERGPEVEKRFGRLRFRRSSLDAFLKQSTEKRRAYS